jgi:hypothetical protein
MKIKQIIFDDEEMPATVIAEMTIREAVFIASMIGRMTDADASEITPDGAAVHYGIWTALTGNVFNAYWDSGLDGAKKL